MLGVVIGLAATVGTFVGAGMLAAYTYNHRQLYLGAWTATLFGLSTALGGMTVGFMVGFGPTLFRWIEIGGSLIAPLWLAAGVVTLIARRIQVWFGVWLAVASYSVIAVVIMAFDPVIGTFDSTLPGPDHYDLLPRILLGGAHLGAVGALAAATGITAMRTRDRDPEALDMLVPIALLAGAGVLVVAGMGGYLPDVLTVMGAAAAAGLVWYGARRATTGVVEVAEPGWAEETAASFQPSTAGRGRRRRGTRRRPSGSRGDHDRGSEEEPPEPDDEAAHRSGPDPDAAHRSASDRGGAHRAGPDPDAAHRSARGQGAHRSGRDREAAHRRGPDPYAAHRSAHSRPGSRTPSRAAGPYGHITVYTLRDGQEDAFDRLTEEAVRAVRELEPDTLIYACHTAHHSPNQRVFYQLYRDRGAYQEHERQPHIRHFLAEGRSYVRNTKVIELKLGPAKVVPPPSL
jgi:quinol monooxygenase YgiN